MIENYDHYISRNIKALYKRRLFSPIVYLIILGIIWHVFSLTDLLFPVPLSDDVSLETFYKEDGYYRLQPENDTMDPILVHGDIQILGKVFGVFRFYK